MRVITHIAERSRQPGLHLGVDVLSLDGELALNGLLMQFLQFGKQYGEFVFLRSEQAVGRCQFIVRGLQIVSGCVQLDVTTMHKEEGT